MKQVFGFSFYGATNIGDDLMVEGYLCALKSASLKIYAAAQDPTSQRVRFPSVDWYSANSEHWERTKTTLLSEGAPWVGMGGTPFQMSSGSWLVDSIVKDLDARPLQSKNYMIGVGAEREVLGNSVEVRRILDRMNLIWTRDVASAEILLEAGAIPSQILVGADLGHIAAAACFPEAPQTERPFKLGLNYFSETALRQSVRSLAEFVVDVRATSPMCFISNEMRKSMEPRMVARIRAHIRWRSLRSGYLAWQSAPSEKNYPLLVPDYDGASIASFLRPYADCDTILTSRYHGVLSAAWANCRIAVLGGRSSKLRSIAEQLGVPILTEPYTATGIHDLYERAVRVDRKKLEQERNKALRSVEQLMTTLADPNLPRTIAPKSRPTTNNQILPDDAVLKTPQDLYCALERTISLPSRLRRSIERRIPLFTTIGSIRINLPPGSQLLRYQRSHHRYDTPLREIAKAIVDAYGTGTCAIDVGANCGDSAAAVRAAGVLKILCIEGDPEILPLLRQNITRMGPDIELVAAFIGREGGAVDLSKAEKLGLNATLVEDRNGEVRLRSLEGVLQENPDFGQAKLLKIDCEGFDFEIIRASSAFLTTARPIVLFEYDPQFHPERPNDGVDVICSMASWGYTTFHYYDNFGNFLAEVAADDAAMHLDLNRFLGSHRRHGTAVHYFDVCAFAAEDAPIAKALRNLER